MKTFAYNSKSQPTSIIAGNAINESYQFYADGNLQHRIDNLTNQKEEFNYDTPLNRLLSWDIYKNSVLQKTVNMAFDSKGNITTKSDLGYSLKYEHPNKPHALTSINGVPASIPEHTQTITYTDFKKIKTILDSVYVGSTLTKKKYEVLYGIDDQRRKTEYFENGISQNSHLYLGNYEVINDGANERKIHYISGGNGIAAIFVENNSNDTTYFVHTDYLGSLTSLTDASGNAYIRYAFDPWGQRRNPADWKSADTRTNLIFKRGFTGHEHLDCFGLINMNGRVYDPVTACFLSPDPFVQTPGSWLNYNRYSYGLNNPMMYTDPSGEIFGLPALLGAAVWGAIASTTIYTTQTIITGSMWTLGGFLKSATVGAVGGLLAPVGGAGMSFGANFGLGVAQGALTGALDAALSGDNIGKGALSGGITGGIFATVTSQNLKNLFKGEGFRINSKVFNRMLKRGMGKQGIIDYFYKNDNITYRPIKGKGADYIESNSYYGSTNTSGKIFFGDEAFSSYDNFRGTYHKELFTSQRAKQGKLATWDDHGGIPELRKMKYFPEEALGFKHAFQNQGLYPNSSLNFLNQANSYWLEVFGESLMKDKNWYYLFYKIPRRW